nr:glycosyltransferase [uncultured Sulfurimonas sp.]
MTLYSTYYFNSSQALADALDAKSNKIFFYDGAVLENAPSNCINVPISNFFDYFLKTIHPQIFQLNFDGTEFSQDTKEQIAQSVSQTIDAIKKQKMEILNTLLNSEITLSNINVMIFVFLQFCRDSEDLNKDIVLKLLKITNFLKENSVLIDAINVQLSNTLLHYLQKDKSILHIHLYYCARYTQDSTSLEIIEEDYFKVLTKHKVILELINNFTLIKTIFPQSRFKEYIQKISTQLFSDDFFELDILEQKKQIFKLYYLSVLNYNRCREYKEIYHVLYSIYTKALEKEQDELVFYLYTPLLMSWDEDSPSQDELKLFNEQVEKPLESFIKNKLIKKYNIKKNKKKINKNEKIKVAFLIDRVIPYSIYNVYYELLKSLSENPSSNYEFTIYNLNFIESGSLNETVDELKKLGLKYVDLHKEYVGDEYPFYEIIDKVIQVRNRLIEDNTDILIGLNSRPEYNFLFTTRTAPKQIYWSHGNNEYDIDAIDKKITHGSLNNREDFERFSIENEENNYNPEIDMEEVKQIRKEYPRDSFILGTIGRLIKIDDYEYLQSVASIMKKNPQTVYLACGSGEKENIKKKVEKLGIADRFFFTGYIDADVYNYVIDLWLEPFKISSGESLNEYMHKNRPYIALWSDWSEKDKLEESYSFDKYVWPYSVENYIDVADELINDKKLVKFVLEKRKPINEKILNSVDRTFLDVISD